MRLTLNPRFTFMLLKAFPPIEHKPLIHTPCATAKLVACFSTLESLVKQFKL